LGEAPDVLYPYGDTIDKAFIGGTRNFRRVIDSSYRTVSV